MIPLIPNRLPLLSLTEFVVAHLPLGSFEVVEEVLKIVDKSA
jgi:hypothetical protein